MDIGIHINIAKILKSLRTNRFDRVEYMEEAGTATDLILDRIPNNATIGIGGSVTIRQIGLVTMEGYMGLGIL